MTLADHLRPLFAGFRVGERFFAYMGKTEWDRAIADFTAVQMIEKSAIFWATAMDIDKARQLGLQPLKQELTRIDRVTNLEQALDAAFAL